MNVQKKEKVEDSLELLMKCEEGAIVELKTHLTRYKNKNKIAMKKNKFHQYNFYIGICWRKR
jgi:hypothetical protein